MNSTAQRAAALLDGGIPFPVGLQADAFRAVNLGWYIWQFDVVPVESIRVKQGSPAATLVIKQDDLLPLIVATLLTSDGDPMDLTGCTVTFRMRKFGVSALTVNAACAVVSPAYSGVVAYTWLDGNTDIAGLYFAEFEVVTGTGSRTTFPNTDALLVQVISDL